ncbi:MAG: class I SAM-dependent methyltransferase [Dehalococcoidales bacterium]
MDYIHIKDIDWDGLWQKQAGHVIKTSDEAAAFWDRRAHYYEKNVGRNTYVDELLKRMEIPASCSVLDVGGGSGLLAVPIAQKARLVTVLDISNGMLSLLKNKLEEAKISNITVINKNWYETDVNSEIDPHDIVLASRFLPMGDKLEASLENMNTVALKRCYVTWRANSFDKVEAESARLLGKEYKRYPEYPIILNCLYKMGIKAGVEIFKSESEMCFDNLDDALRHFSKNSPMSDITSTDYKDFVRSLLVEKDGKYYRYSATEWALISWEARKRDV